MQWLEYKNTDLACDVREHLFHVFDVLGVEHQRDALVVGVPTLVHVDPLAVGQLQVARHVAVADTRTWWGGGGRRQDSSHIKGMVCRGYWYYRVLNDPTVTLSLVLY